MTSKPTLTRRALVVGSGLAVAGLLGGALALPTVIAPPTAQYVDVDSITVSAGERVLVCPGTAALTTAPTASSVTYDLELAGGADTIEAKTTLVDVSASSGDQTSGLVGEQAVGIPQVFTATAEPTPRLATFRPDGGTRSSIAGMTVGSADTGDLRGLIAGACHPPAASLWLVGGDTEIGSSTQLVLTNPGETPARVTVEAWSALGKIPGEIVVLLDPGSSSIVLTETLERTENIAFHVAAEGGTVGGYLLTTTLDGIVPGGVSYVTPSAVPGLETFVGPLRLEEAATTDWTTDLRILNPGTEPATVSISLLGPTGEETLPGAESITVEAGMLARIPLTAAQMADYTVWVQADALIVASASTVAHGDHDPDLAGSPTDLSWMASSHPADELVLLNGPGAAFALTNPDLDPIEIQVEQIDSDGNASAPEWFEISPSTTIALAAQEDAAAIRISGGMILASAQYYRDAHGPLIAHVPAVGLTGGERTVAVVAGN